MTKFLAFPCVCVIALLEVALFKPTHAFGADSDTAAAPSRIDIPLDDDSRAQILLTLKSIRPPAGMKDARVFKTSDGRIVLYGDLFNNRQPCAIVEYPHDPEADPGDEDTGVAFAQWNGKEWEPRSLWKITPIWRPKGWKATGQGYPWITPADEPFRMMEVAPGKPPLAVISGAIGKYYQEYFLAKYDPQSRSLVIIDQNEGATPVDGYVRTYGSSGHLSTFELWDFYRWDGDSLVHVAHWYEGMEGHDEESSVTEADVYDKDGKSSVSYSYHESGLINRGGGKFAQITFHWSKSRGDDEKRMLEHAYLFEKFTGLPRKLYPGLEGSADPSKFEEQVKIVLAGPPTAVKQLSPSTKSKWWPF